MMEDKVNIMLGKRQPPPDTASQPAGKMIKITAETNTCQHSSNKKEACVRGGINNLPPTVPVEPFLGREEELKKLTLATKNQERNHLIDVAITGMPGIGKTQLVHKFISESSSQFANVIWISANSDIQSQFILLAKTLNVVHDKFKVSNDTNMLLIISEVYNKLSNLNTVLIFDNVLTDILKYLPPVHKNRNDIFVIITSVFKEWQCSLCLPLQCFSLEISEQFLVQNLENCSVENAQKLAQNFDNLPLALQNLVLYFKNKQKISNLERNTFCVDDLVHETILTEEFRCKYDPGLFYKFVPFSLLKDTVALESLCSSVIQRFEKNHFGTFSVKLLKLMAYLDPDKIVLRFFDDVKNELKINISNALISLNNFSLLSINKGNISISPVIQNVIKNAYKNENILGEVLLYMKSKMTEDNDEPFVNFIFKPHVIKIFNEHQHNINILQEFHILFMAGICDGKWSEILLPVTNAYSIISSQLKEVDLLNLHCIYLHTLCELCDKGFTSPTYVLEACNKIIDEISIEKMKNEYYGLKILRFKCQILHKLNIELENIWDLSQYIFQNMHTKYGNGKEAIDCLLLICQIAVKSNSIEKIQQCKEDIMYACLNIFDEKYTELYDHKMPIIDLIIDYYFNTKLEDVAFHFITKLKIRLEIKYKEKELNDTNNDKIEAECMSKFFAFKSAECLFKLGEMKRAWDILYESTNEDINYIATYGLHILITLINIASNMEKKFKTEVVKLCYSRVLTLMTECCFVIKIDKVMIAIYTLAKELAKIEMNSEILNLYDHLEKTFKEEFEGVETENIVVSRIQIYKLLYMCENTNNLLEIAQKLAEICKTLDLESPYIDDDDDLKSVNKVVLIEKVKKVETLVMELWEKEDTLKNDH